MDRHRTPNHHAQTLRLSPNLGSPAYLLAPFHVDAGTSETSEEAALVQWPDLDCLLVKFWESRSIRPRVICPLVFRTPKGEMPYRGSMKDWIRHFLPETMGRGMIDLVGAHY